jgi:hypothetical protein
MVLIDHDWHLLDAPAPLALMQVNQAPDFESDLRFEAAGVPAGCRVRAVIVARGHPDLTPWSRPRADATGGGALPADTVETMLRLYQGPVYWWLEARDDDGVVQAQSRLLRLDR